MIVWGGDRKSEGYVEEREELEGVCFVIIIRIRVMIIEGIFNLYCILYIISFNL